jgi:uncharacterized membrane protein YqjE
MAEPAVRHHANGARDQSIGSLVSLAVSDVSQLVKCEIDLAKLELKKDVTRLGMGAALVGMGAFVGCLILLFAGFGLAISLAHALHIPVYAGFFCVAGICAFLAGLALLIGLMRFRKLSGLRRTRRTVQDDLALLKHEGAPTAHPAIRAS